MALEKNEGEVFLEHKIYVGTADVNIHLELLTGGVKALGFWRCVKGNAEIRNRQKEKRKCDVQVKFTVTFCNILFVLQVNEVQWSLVSQLGSSLHFQCVSGDVQNPKSTEVGGLLCLWLFL